MSWVGVDECGLGLRPPHRGEGSVYADTHCQETQRHATTTTSTTPAISYPLGGGGGAGTTTMLPSSVDPGRPDRSRASGDSGPRRKGLSFLSVGKAPHCCLGGHFSPSPALCRAMLPWGPGVGGLGQVHLFLPPWQPVPPTSLRDEDLQLQLALRLSRQEHQKVVG